MYGTPFVSKVLKKVVPATVTLTRDTNSFARERNSFARDRNSFTHGIGTVLRVQVIILMRGS